MMDADKWNHTVLSSRDGTLFACHEYLDQMTSGWSGLVIGDYEMVLPLTDQSKWGIKYLSAIPFVRQLGLIGDGPGPAAVCLKNQADSAALYRDIFKAIHRFARYGDICFNHHNAVVFEGSGRDSRMRPSFSGTQLNQGMYGGEVSPVPNYEIHLQQGYERIFADFHRPVKKKLTRIKKEGILKYSLMNAQDVLADYRALLQEKSGLKLESAFQQLKRLLPTEFGRHHFTGYQIQDSSSQQVLLTGIYGKDQWRIYKFMTAVTPAGRKQHASVFALDHLLATYAGEDLVFDFMGSRLPGVRTFIQSFGAVNHPCYLYHFNRLPWPLRLLKK